MSCSQAEVLPRRADTTRVVGAGLEIAAAGLGHRRIAVMLGVDGRGAAAVTPPERVWRVWLPASASGSGDGAANAVSVWPAGINWPHYLVAKWIAHPPDMQICDRESGEALRRFRETELGMSRAELAAELAVTRHTVARWESGDRAPDPESVDRIVRLGGR